MSAQTQIRGVELLRMADVVTPMALRAAATLRLADLIAGGAHEAGEIAAATNCQPRPLRKLLEHLCALGVLREEPPGSYEVDELGFPLLSENDHLGVRPFLDIDHVVGRAELSLVEILHTLRTGGPAYEGAHGRNLWDDLDGGVAVGGMEAFVRTNPGFDADLIVDGYDWSAVESVVDVGGNSGALVSALLRAHPHLRATLVDLPCFARMAERSLELAGLADRCQVVGSSFFDPLPPGADVYLVSAILADWDDDRAIAILRRCAEAAGDGGVVLLAEVHLSAAHADPVERTAVALRLEASMGNPDRTVSDLEALAAGAGLEVAWRGLDSPVRSVMALRPVQVAAGRSAR
ncbi:MAG: methyltransferase [Egibacteraceae bacterium]